MSVADFLPPRLDAGGLETLRRALQEADRRDRMVSLGKAATATKAGDLMAEYRTVTTPANVDTEFSVSHALGRVPEGVLLVVNENSGLKPVVIYPSGTPWTATTIYLKHDLGSTRFWAPGTADAAITLLIF